MSLGRNMYKVARTTRTVEQVARGRGVNRAKNIAVGRAAGRVGLWHLLWGKGKATHT